MPVDSISILPMIGMVQLLPTPGIATAASSSSRRSSNFLNWGRHSFMGLSVTLVSIISSGAGSVGVSARPALPKTCSTSGNCFMILFWTCMMPDMVVMEAPGTAVGMNSSVPSYKGGMNSDPSCENGKIVTSTITMAMMMTVFRNRSENSATG